MALVKLDFCNGATFGLRAKCEAINRERERVTYRVRLGKGMLIVSAEGAETWERHFDSFDSLWEEIERIAPTRKWNWVADYGGIYSGSPFGDGRGH